MRPKIPQKLAERFRRVCPIWAKHILDDPYDYDFPDAVFRDTDGNLWSLIEPGYCIVGEAHGRQSHYNAEDGCHECRTYANDLMETQRKWWLIILKDFLNHYEKCHPNVSKPQEQTP